MKIITFKAPLCLVFVITLFTNAFAVETAFEGFPVWIDYEKVFQATPEKSQATSLLQVNCDGKKYTAEYVYNTSGYVEHINLLSVDKTPRRVMRANLAWIQMQSQPLLTKLEVEKEDSSLSFSDEWKYTDAGKVQSRRVAGFGEEQFTKAMKFDDKGRCLFEKTVRADKTSFLRAYSYDAQGALVQEKKSVYVDPNNKAGSAAYKEEVSFLPNNRVKKQYKATKNGVITSHVEVEWSKNDAGQITYLKKTGQGVNREASFIYTKDGLLEKKIKPNGVEITYTYDANKRLVDVHSSDESCLYHITYDNKNRIIKAVSPQGGTLERTYANDLLVTETLDEKSSTYRYDEKKRLILTQFPDRSSLGYVYNEERLIAYVRKDEHGNLLYRLEVPVGKEKECEKKDASATSTFTFQDPMGEYTLDVTYDAFGQICATKGPLSDGFAFDALGMLVTYNGQEIDRNGLGEPLEVGKWKYTYDANGNMVEKRTSGHVYTMTYDALDRLEKVYCNGKEIAQYTYDIFCRRTKENESHYLWLENQEIGRMHAEQITALKIGAQYPDGIELHHTLYQTQCDVQGSITALIDAKTQKVVQVNRYSPFGKKEEKIGLQEARANPWGFCGKSMLQGPDLVYFGARTYDPASASWLSSDPMHFIDGVNTKAFNQNDPLHNVDEFGLFALPINMTDMGRKMVKDWAQLWNNMVLNVTMSRTKFDWLCDIRHRLEDVMFRIRGRQFWAFLGYNMDPTKICDAGASELNDRVRLTLINGILNDYNNTQSHAKLLSEMHGNAKIHYLYSASKGWTTDLYHGLIIEMGFVPEPARLLAKMWKDLIRDMGGVKSGGIIIHYAHSLGGGDTYRALELLTEEERRMVRVNTFGSPVLIKEGSCQSVKNYIANGDVVPGFFDPVGYFQGRLGNRPDVHFLPKNTWGSDHLFTNPPYREQLEKEGKAVQQQYRHLKDGKKELIHLSLLDFNSKSFPLRKEVSTVQNLEQHLVAKEYGKLGKELAHAVPGTMTLNDIQALAIKNNSTALQRAVRATQNIMALQQNIGMNEGAMLQIALFMETEFQKHIDHKKYYLRRSSASLPRDIEYDPMSKYRFIHLQEQGVAKIGAGAHKTVTKTILYDVEHPEVCANSEGDYENEYEMHIMQKLNGARGIVEGRAFIKHTKSSAGKNKLEMICKMYKYSLRSNFYHKMVQFSFPEKVKIATDLMAGLRHIHHCGYIYRDVHLGNFLVNVQEKEGQARSVEAVIIDFGRTCSMHSCKGIDTEAACTYRSPEGWLFENLKGKDYCSADVYAIGCVLYQVLYEKDPPWFTARYMKAVKADSFSRREGRQILASRIQQEIQILPSLQKRYQALSPQDKFKCVVFSMVQPDPSKRPSAKEAHALLQGILDTQTNAVVKKKAA